MMAWESLDVCMCLYNAKSIYKCYEHVIEWQVKVCDDYSYVPRFWVMCMCFLLTKRCLGCVETHFEYWYMIGLLELDQNM